MGRPKADLGAGADDRIIGMMARGMGPDAIAAELGGKRSTVARRMKELRSGVPAARAVKRKAAGARVAAIPPVATTAPSIQQGALSTPALPLPTPAGEARAAARAALLEADDETLEQTPLEQIQAWLKMAREEVEIARIGSDTDMLQKMTRLAATLLTLQQKHTPIVPPDPNDHPDFVAAAARVRERWHETLTKAFVAKAFVAMGKALQRRYAA